MASSRQLRKRRPKWRCDAFLVLVVASISAVTSEAGGIDKVDTVILVKIGGSSITHKGEFESLNEHALAWFSRSIAKATPNAFLAPPKEEVCDVDTTNEHAIGFVIVHGAGSFGHFTAKEYGLKGHSEEPPTANKRNTTTDSLDRRRDLHGLAKTRLSVQKLNGIVVKNLVDHGVNAVGISPCFGIPGLETHAHLQPDEQELLQSTVRRTLQAGLVPVLHGDACLYGNDGVGILSGDVLMKILGVQPWVDNAVFITDVDGVFDQDPRQNVGANLLQKIAVNPSNGEIVAELTASRWSHDHDVTGGLKVGWMLFCAYVAILACLFVRLTSCFP